MNTPVKKTFKELARLLIIALVSFLLTEGVSLTIVKWIIGTTLSPEMIVIVTGIVTTTLKTVENYYYEAGSTNFITETLRFEGRV